MDTVDLANYFNCTRDFIVRTLHRGTDAGLCFYDGKKNENVLQKKDKIKIVKTIKKFLYFLRKGCL